jgi:MEMO1 family protein
MLSARPAAVAGLFYPGNPQVLADEVDVLLDGVEHHAPRLAFPKALVVPHAGYVYSGSIAARAYDELAPARGIVNRVVLLGPAHRVALPGLAVPTAGAFETPLGRVPVDAGAVRAVQGLPQVVASEAAHAMEHSLEVQLPFLQKVLGRFELVPLAVGTASATQVEEVLARLWGGPETLIVVSTDLSHYRSYDEARALDAATLKRICARATDIDHEEACGATPLNGLLAVARKRDLSVSLLAACNSGDTAGDKDRVVGYSALALYEGNAVAQEEAGRTLVSIARGAIEARLFDAAPVADCGASWLRQVGATFVTLTSGGALRGCIGSLQAARSLAEDVTDNALGAAFRDPRFPALAAAEWPRCAIAVSLVSAAKPLRFANEAELLAQLQVGVDGLIVEADGRRATFLPQVWHSLPDKRAFVAELLRKAGLPAGTPLARCRASRYRVVTFDGS